MTSHFSQFGPIQKEIIVKPGVACVKFNQRDSASKATGTIHCLARSLLHLQIKTTMLLKFQDSVYIDENASIMLCLLLQYVEYFELGWVSALRTH